MLDNRSPNSASPSMSVRPIYVVAGLTFGLVVLIASVASVAYHLGANQPRLANLSEAVLHATATHGGTNVAVATGQVSEEAEGIFILDYVTGNLQCWVYYPRMQAFGAKFGTSINQQLPQTKNAEYLLVTGTSIAQQATSNARPAGCICYVVDTKSGMFAAYSLPWNRQAEISGQTQSGQLVFMGGDQFRLPIGGAPAKKLPTPTKETGKEKAPAAK